MNNINDLKQHSQYQKALEILSNGGSIEDFHQEVSQLCESKEYLDFHQKIMNEMPNNPNNIRKNQKLPKGIKRNDYSEVTNPFSQLPDTKEMKFVICKVLVYSPSKLLKSKSKKKKWVEKFESPYILPLTEQTALLNIKKNNAQDVFRGLIVIKNRVKNSIYPQVAFAKFQKNILSQLITKLHIQIQNSYPYYYNKTKCHPLKLCKIQLPRNNKELWRNDLDSNLINFQEFEKCLVKSKYEPYNLYFILHCLLKFKYLKSVKIISISEEIYTKAKIQSLVNYIFKKLPKMKWIKILVGNINKTFKPQ